jgi:anti-anti-sigma regulatory factor
MSSVRKQKRKTIKAASRLDTAEAPRLYASLLRNRNVDLKLDLSQVHWIGAACAEILVSAARPDDRPEGTITFLNPTTEFEAGLDILGLSDWFRSQGAGQL